MWLEKQTVQLVKKVNQSTVSTVFAPKKHLAIRCLKKKKTHTPTPHVFHFLSVEAGWISWRTEAAAAATANSADCRDTCYKFHLCGPTNSFDLTWFVNFTRDYQLQRFISCHITTIGTPSFDRSDKHNLYGLHSIWLRASLNLLCQRLILICLYRKITTLCAMLTTVQYWYGVFFYGLSSHRKRSDD